MITLLPYNYRDHPFRFLPPAYIKSNDLVTFHLRWYMSKAHHTGKQVGLYW